MDADKERNRALEREVKRFEERKSIEQEVSAATDSHCMRLLTGTPILDRISRNHASVQRVYRG